MKALTVSGAALAYFGLVSAATPSSLPHVDLGYEVHEALSYNETLQQYSFINIRYAQPPTGDLRFKAPVPPDGRDPDVQNGNRTRICPQAFPSWPGAASAFGQSYLNGTLDKYNRTAYMTGSAALFKILEARNTAEAGVTEDCLFLDVTVPKAIFDNRAAIAKAPVFIWIHGGAYAFGHKTDPLDGGKPGGLIKASQMDGSDGMVFVAMNYRLGAYGFLQGASLDEAGGTPNVGLHDQRLALEWVQRNIHLFGGDPNQVTIAGVSAGSGSIVHHLTAYGGQNRPPPFARAFLNSPGYQGFDSQFVSENRTRTFLKYLNVSTLDEARSLDVEALKDANLKHVFSADIGFIYGPTVDGSYVPSLPGPAILQGNIHSTFQDKKIDLLLSHTRWEGGEFNTPWVNTDQDFVDMLRNWISPTIQDEAAEKLAQLYPGENAVRSIEFFADYGFVCNTDWLSRAWGNSTYNYEFDITPAFHGYDVQFTFYGVGQPRILGALPGPRAIELQQYITNFAKTGNPNGKGLPPFPQRGVNGSMNVMRADGWTNEKDWSIGERCSYLQHGLYV